MNYKSYEQNFCQLSSYRVYIHLYLDLINLILEKPVETPKLHITNTFQK